MLNTYEFGENAFSSCAALKFGSPAGAGICACSGALSASKTAKADGEADARDAILRTQRVQVYD